jgi:VCBS repeat-containing protein
MRRVRLVIADRRPIVLEGFASMFVAQRDFEIVASCRDGASCLEALRNMTPDVALVEDGFSDVTASEILAVANAEKFPTRLVFFTASVALGDLAAAIEAGACSAISMRARPETVLQSLRLVAGGASFPPEPRPDRAPAGKEENGAVGENVLAVLTDREIEIMRLVAEGLSNKAIARQLKVSDGTIKVHLHHIFQKLEINNRTELAALALSLPRYGGLGALAALILSAIDDVQATDLNVVNAGHAVTDTFTVMAADGTPEVATIIIRPKALTVASDATARAVVKARGVASAAPGTSKPTGKIVDPGVDNTASTVTLAALSSPRPSSGVSGTFMMAAAGMWIYALGNSNSAAQAFDLGDSLPDVFTVANANDIQQLVPITILSGADADPDGFDNLALINWGIPDLPFAFGIPGGDTAAIGRDELQIANGDDARASDTIDHGVFAMATATDAPEHVEQHGATLASAGGGSNPGQSQRALHAASEDSSAVAEQHDASRGNGAGPEQSQRHLRVASDEDPAAARQHADHDAPAGGSDRGQSQRDLHAASGDGSAVANQHDASRGNGAGPEQSQRHLRIASDEDPATAKRHAEHDVPGGGSDRGQSQRDLHAEDGFAVAEQHSEHDATPGSGASPAQAQRDLHQGPVASNHPHSESSLSAGGWNQAATAPTAAPELGDSFHFKNEMADFKNSDAFGRADMDHGPDLTAHGQHAGGHNGLPSIQDADPIGPSLVKQNAADHARAEHHVTHDLIV